MSALTACLLVVFHVAPRHMAGFKPEFGEPAPMTLRVPYGPRVTWVGAKSAQLEYRRIVIPAGRVLDPRRLDDVIVVSHELNRRAPGWVTTFGYGLLFFAAALALAAHLNTFGQNRLRLLRVQVGIFSAIVLFALAAKAFLLFISASAYWIPAATIPLWVATSYDRRTAFMVAIVCAVVAAVLADFDVLILSVMLIQGAAATLYYFDRKHLRSMFFAAAFAGLTVAAAYGALVAVFEGQASLPSDSGTLKVEALIACVGGGLLSGAIGVLFRGLAERLLGHVSRERLLDLTDLEQPLLKKLAREAPGTYEHSRAMANLAEQAASAIGADALLTRVGAYYHDLGKTVHPKYFVENLGPDEKSPHDALEPEVSARKIITHVVEGTRILRGGKIPEPVIEFSYTHHGTQVVEYFWNKCLEEGNPRNLDQSEFRYPGMKPQTKETAILMLVDSIEAASRTVEPPERAQFEIMIQRVILTKLGQRQLDDCGLDLKELRVISERTAQTLVNMHHHRIKYHWQAKRAEEFGVSSRVVREGTRADRRMRGGRATAAEARPTEGRSSESSSKNNGEESKQSEVVPRSRAVNP